MKLRSRVAVVLNPPADDVLNPPRVANGVVDPPDTGFTTAFATRGGLNTPSAGGFNSSALYEIAARVNYHINICRI